MSRRARRQAAGMVVERIDVHDTLVDVALRAAITAHDNHVAGDRIEGLGRAELVGRNCVCRGEVNSGLGIPDIVDLVEALIAVLVRAKGKDAAVRQQRQMQPDERPRQYSAPAARIHDAFLLNN